MAFEVDEDILQDFLVEAGEILELLSEQLVELENNPEDADLLNAIFRGFHTVKGGAGFLSLTTLVDACHGAENVFDILRNGQRSVTSELMDVILQTLDTINEMFAVVKARGEPDAADPALLEALHRFCLEDSAAPEPVDIPEPVSIPEPIAPEPEIFDSPASSPMIGGSDDSSIDEITDDEFEALLDELHGSGNAPTVQPASAESAPASASSPDISTFSGGDEDISDDEFEALLDELHGKGQFSTAAENTPQSSAPPSAPATSAVASTSSDDISDDEFESLLDELHGKGKAPQSVTPVENAPPKVEPPKKEEPKTESPKAEAPSPAAAPSAPPTPASAPPKPVASNSPAPVAAKPAEKKKAATPPPAQETTVRVDTSRLDQIMNMVGELVLVRNRLVSLATEADERMSKAIANLDVVTGDLQGAVMKTRMQPIKKVFGRFPRVVRDLARSLNKEISLELEGEETDLDKNLVEALADPLVHLVRNSVDHGIEMPDVRESNGKPRCGIVKLSASQEGDHILLTITDDGAGMDPEKLKNIAISKGILDTDAAGRLSDNEAYNLIFAPGFSTKAEISDISGRGVGMDVVKTKITQLNGSVNIDSELGSGTKLEIKVPLTLAILPTLMVVIAEQTFALPLAAVSEIINLDLNKTNTVDGQLTMIVRQKAIPLFYLEKWLNRLGVDSSVEGEGHVVVVQLGADKQIGFVVDSLIGQEEVVIKPLDALLQGTPGMAGATITSDGGIALIIDIPSLLKHYATRRA
ncbi:chemotaxis protein CheA [Algibacillus agarilyticus]|uniref:chemotaxis protein CheA n=1 Tax=Algibacillus agarilyticus TaxID=2234133 RepID=UPI000DD0D8A5|nr:chemotaxis protein CheA [Algibacillus agarilyticus]